jgi:hypothetical protein
MQAAMGKPRPVQVESVWVTMGMDSLTGLSHLLKCEIPTILELTLAAAADHKFAPDLHEYLVVGDLGAKLPKGVNLRYLKTGA